ncbi:MAG: M23 family metallopeptidase [Flavobacteriales bacterium]
MKPRFSNTSNRPQFGNTGKWIAGAMLGVILLSLMSVSSSKDEVPVQFRRPDINPDSILAPVYPQDYFGSPLDVPLHLSGNFGELRTNHFHAGIDIKTQQQEGLKIYSAAEGYVSRIKVSPVGYGYALYVDHPNGYTTVYGHMKQYNEVISGYVQEEQYAQKSFSVDVFPKPGELPVEKGTVLGLSGNSGGSGGPHLHFEIRETRSEKTINPLLFGYKLADKIPPSVSRVWIVPMSDSTRIASGTVPVSYETIAGAGSMKLNVKSPPVVYGDVGFAIHTSDQFNGNANRCGIYRIELFVDGLQVYGQRMDRLDFTTNRAMNAHTIYERFKKDRSQLHGSYRLPGNPLDIYDNLVNDGIVSFRDGKVYDIEYRVHDIEGNLSVVKFKVQAQTGLKVTPQAPKNRLMHFDWEQDNRYENDEVKIHIPPFTLYEDTDLTITKSKQIQGTLIPTFLIASPYEPVHAPVELAFNVSHVKPSLHDKLTVVRWDPDKDKVIAEGGVVKDGWIAANPMYLGYFSVKADTTPPAISSIDFSTLMQGRRSFSLKISDWLSGIKEYYPTIDGEWVLMEYDAKSSRITCYFDPKRMTRGSHRFEIRVTDQVGNEKTWSSAFTW